MTATITIGGKQVAVKTRGSSSQRKRAKRKKPLKPPAAEESREEPVVAEKPKTRKTPKNRVVTVEAKHKKDRRDAKTRETNEAEEYETIRDIAWVPKWSSAKKVNFRTYNPDKPKEGGINWDRRMQAKADPFFDLETYHPNVFRLGWADYHKGLINAIEERIHHGGRKAYGCPRGGGKTAISRGMSVRATKFGFRKFLFFIGSKEDKATQTLDWIKGFWFASPELQQDFPEIAYPVYRVEGRSTVGSQGQLFRGNRTRLNWSSKEIQYPCMLLNEEDAAGYREHDPDCIQYLPEYDRWIVKAAGTLIRVAGIDGSIRGEADLHPILLTQPRPDMILLDDVQKDQKADSPKACEDLERLIESAVDYLSEPDIAQAMMMPCTVIREGDVSDMYLNSAKKPDWAGERHGLIEEYPAGITDNAIYDEIDGVPNVQGKLWLEYQEIREGSLQKHGDLRIANDFYRRNQAILEDGFVVSWKEYYKRSGGDKAEYKDEISAIQSAMNKRFKDHLSFLSECQNRPRSKVDLGGIMLTPAEVAEHTTQIPRDHLSSQWTNLVAFIDVHDEIFFYAVLAHDHAFNGQFVDYGTFPKVNTSYFRKNQTLGWSLLTRAYYKANPNERPTGKILQARHTAIRAPFDAKIRLALEQCTQWLLARQFVYHGIDMSPISIRALAIDAKWGKVSEPVKRFVRETADPRIMPYNGQAFMPSHRQLEEYQQTPGWLFEHQQHPNTRESTWVIKPYLDGGRYILADVNRLKTCLMKRLATPKGSEGCITLFESPPESHRMFADHIAASQYPEPITARGMTKDCWQSIPNARDEDDYLDCCVGCVGLASICGASLKTTGQEAPVRKRSLRRAYQKQVESRRKLSA